MEIKDLYPAVLLLVLVGMLLGIGILTIDKFGDATKESVDLLGETLVTSSNTGTTANDDVTAILGFSNLTGEVYQSSDMTNGSINFTLAGVITVDSGFGDGVDNIINYTYDEDTTTTTTMASVTSAISPVATTWLPLIVTVLALAIVLGLVIKSFGKQGR